MGPGAGSRPERRHRPLLDGAAAGPHAQQLGPGRGPASPAKASVARAPSHTPFPSSFPRASRAAAPPRRHLLAELSDEAYASVQSFHSDSAVSFSLFLNHLPDMRAQQPPDVLLQAMQARGAWAGRGTAGQGGRCGSGGGARAWRPADDDLPGGAARCQLRRLKRAAPIRPFLLPAPPPQDTIATITRVQQQRGISETSLLNFVVSDGTTIVATRFVTPDSDTAATLYYAEGAR